jgi:hypothetical protein
VLAFEHAAQAPELLGVCVAAGKLFAGSLRAGQRAAAVMRLVHAARINGHSPCAQLKDILSRSTLRALGRASR